MTEFVLDIAEEIEFKDLGLRDELLVCLEKIGFKTPSPIQKQAIPLILSGVDVIGHAQTGTGKTAAFSLPAVQSLKNTGGVEVLVITPTRELASQVSEEIKRLSFTMKTRIATVYGGKPFQTQIESIRKGAQIVVATPGRLLDLLQSEKIPGFKPSLVIVDEADEMLDMGFLDDIKAIFEYLPESRQTLLFSATMPPAIQNLANKILKSPTLVQTKRTQTTNTDISQLYSVISDKERDEAVIRLFETREMGKTILFCKTKKEVDRLSQVLKQRRHAATSLHGDMEQNQRETVLKQFRSGESQVLVATDVAARGINIVDINYVINFHIPFDADNYTHRIGRTGRAGRKGSSITLVTPRELSKLLQFQQRAGGQLEKLLIPSKAEVRKFQMQRLIRQLKDQAPVEETSAILNSLENIDMKTLTGKLLGWALALNPIEGPETIGVSEDHAPSSRSPFKRKGGSEPRRKSSQRYAPKPFAKKRPIFKKAKKK